MSEKEKTINIEFKLDSFNGVQECNTDEEQLEAKHYRKIQETKEGQDLIQGLAKVINSIGNIDNFIKALEEYIKYYIVYKTTNKPNHRSNSFKIDEIKFDLDSNNDCIINRIIDFTFNNNNDYLKNVYYGIIEQFNNVCETIDKISDLKDGEIDNLIGFTKTLSFETMSPLAISLINKETIKKEIKEAFDSLKVKVVETTKQKELLKCISNFNNFIDGIDEAVSFAGGANKINIDIGFKEQAKGKLMNIKDKHGRNFLHYAYENNFGHTERGRDTNTGSLLMKYANDNKSIIQRAWREKDVYGLTPLCCLFIDAYDTGGLKSNSKTTVNNIIKFFNEQGIRNTELSEEELQAIYDYFQITKDIQGNYRNYDEFIKSMKEAGYYYSQNNTITKNERKNYKPQKKYKATTNKEQKLINDDSIDIETFLSDGGGYKDKVGDFFGSLFNEIYNTNSQFGEDCGSDKYKQYYMNKQYDKIYSIIAGIHADKIDSIKQDEKLEYIQATPGKNSKNRSNYCSYLFIKAFEQRYEESNNPDIMFKFLSDFCEKDMKTTNIIDNYISAIKYFLDNPKKINDDVKQNIKSLIRYMIENNKITNFSFIKSIINNKTFGINAQMLIEDIVLTAIDNDLPFPSRDGILNSQQLVQELCDCGFGDTSTVLGTSQQNLSTFTIVKNLILSDIVKENEDVSRYSGLNDKEKAKLKQILAKTVAITKIIRKGSQNCSDLKGAVINFVSGNIGLTIEDIEKIKIGHDSIADFCKRRVSKNKKCAYYSWFLNKLVVNNYIANNPSGNTIERSGSETRLLPGNGQQTTTPTNIIIDTYKEFENYKNNTVKKCKTGTSYTLFSNNYMNSGTGVVTRKGSTIRYQDIKPVYDYEQRSNNSETSKTLESIVSNREKDDIQSDLEKYKLQQQVNANKERSEEFKKFCAVFDLIIANTLLFNAVVKKIGQPDGNGNGYSRLK